MSTIWIALFNPHSTLNCSSPGQPEIESSSSSLTGEKKQLKHSQQQLVSMCKCHFELKGARISCKSPHCTNSKMGKIHVHKLSSPFISFSTVGIIYLMTLLILPDQGSCDIFSSTSHLQNLMYLERHIVTSMYDYVNEMEEKLAQVRK